MTGYARFVMEHCGVRSKASQGWHTLLGVEKKLATLNSFFAPCASAG